MTRRRQTPSRPARTRIMVACEGESERGYAALLNGLVRQSDKPFHIEPILLSGGSPLVCINKAVREMRRHERLRGDFAYRVALLYTDRLDQTNKERTAVERIAGECGIRILWQTPCFEAFLLRHFAGHERDQPATCVDAMIALQRVWPEYRKNMSASELARRIRLEDCNRRAQLDLVLADMLRFLNL
jgi:hypothetical protein